MTVRVERRRIARVALSGSPAVWTHEGVAARLLDLSPAHEPPWVRLYVRQIGDK